MDKDEWVQIKGYEGFYEINRNGDVKSLPRKKLVKKVGYALTKVRILRRCQVNYPHFTLTNKYGKKRTELLHRLLAIAFIPNPYNKPEVNHIDSDPSNFNLSNLEWVTKSENEQHSRIYGSKRPIRGEKNVLCKISYQDVLNVREMYKKGNIKQKELAKMFNITSSRISTIVNNKCRVYE